MPIGLHTVLYNQWINATIISPTELYCDCDLIIPMTKVLGVYTSDYDYSTNHETSEPEAYSVSYRPNFSTNTKLRFATNAYVSAFMVLAIGVG